MTPPLRTPTAISPYTYFRSNPFCVQLDDPNGVKNYARAFFYYLMRKSAKNNVLRVSKWLKLECSPKSYFFQHYENFTNNKKKLCIKGRKMMTEINWVQNRRNSENQKKNTRAVLLGSITKKYFGKVIIMIH